MALRSYRAATPATASRQSGAARSPGGGRLSGWLALLLGAGALAIAMVQPTNNSTQTGFMASSIGVFAITMGAHALRQRRMGYRSATLPARAGILFGAIGTAAMAYTLAAFLLLPSGVILPALPSLAVQNASPNGLVLGAPPPAPLAPEPLPPAAPVAAGFATAEEERLALVQTVGTAAFVLGQLRPVDSAWPESVSFDLDGVTLVDGLGQALVMAPAGSQLLYSRSSDGTQFSLTLVGGQFAMVASYDSTTGFVS